MALLWKSCSIPYLLLYKKLLQDSGLKQQRTFIILIVSEIGDPEATKLGGSGSESLMRLCDLTPTLVDVQPELEEPVPGWLVHMAGKLVLAVGGGALVPPHTGQSTFYLSECLHSMAAGFLQSQ